MGETLETDNWSASLGTSAIRLTNFAGYRTVQQKECAMRLRVDYYYDPESKNWGFAVPSLRIVGGADTREEAEQEAIEAVEFALEGVEEPVPEDTELGYLEVTISRPAATSRRVG
jgi:predicted RNase H-like HicB family nuclease